MLLEDKEKIVKLINEIKKCLEEKIRQKNLKVADLISLGVKVGVGVAGAFLTKGFSCALNSLGAAAWNIIHF